MPASKEPQQQQQQREHQEATQEVQTCVQSELSSGDTFVPVSRFPLVEDPRLAVEGAAWDETGKLLCEAYVDLKEYFAGEPPLEQHPDPKMPGIRLDELCERPLGVRWWADKRGAGWVAQHPFPRGGRKVEERWFSSIAWRSWRLAFILARLQRTIWERHSAFVEEAPGVSKRSKPRGLKTPDSSPKREAREPTLSLLPTDCSSDHAASGNDLVASLPEAVRTLEGEADDEMSVKARKNKRYVKEHGRAVLNRNMSHARDDDQETSKAEETNDRDTHSRNTLLSEPCAEVDDKAAVEEETSHLEAVTRMKPVSQSIAKSSKKRKLQEETIHSETSTKEAPLSKVSSKPKNTTEREAPRHDAAAGIRKALRALAPAENLGARVTEEVGNQEKVIARDTKTGCSPSLQVSVTETDKRKAGREASYELHAGEMTAQAGESQRQHSIGTIQGAHNPLVVNSLDVRLTVAGAVCDQTGRLLTGAYKCLISRFAHQPQEKQPDPLRPGLLHHECTEAVSLVGLRWWSSPGTCGWIAQASNTEVERRFSVQMWNSWRLAFLLARLQRDVWESKLSNHAANSCSSTEHTSELRQHSPRERQEVSQCHAADRAPVCGLRGVRPAESSTLRQSLARHGTTSAPKVPPSVMSSEALETRCSKTLYRARKRRAEKSDNSKMRSRDLDSAIDAAMEEQRKLGASPASSSSCTLAAVSCRASPPAAPDILMAASSSSTDGGHYVFLQTPQSAEFESTTDARGGVEPAVANRYVPFKSLCEQSKRDCLAPDVYAEISGDGFEQVVQVSEESMDEEVHSGPIRPLMRPGEVKVAGGHKDEVEKTLGELLKLRTMLQKRSDSDGAGLIDLCD